MATTTTTVIEEGAEIIVAGRTAPVPLGQQTVDKSIPVAVASDQEAIPVREVDATLSEVELSLLGIPRSEVALSLFADVTTYDANPSEWQVVRRNNPGDSDTVVTSTAASTVFEHYPNESAARVTSSSTYSSTEFGILASKRTFRYQPGRVSGATFGVSCSKSTNTDDIKKWGAFDRFDGYYFEIQGGDQTPDGYDLYCVRRSSALAAQVAPDTGNGDIGTAGTNVLLVRDGVYLLHAGLFDKSLRVTTGGTTLTDGTVTFQVDTDYQYVYEYRVPRRYFAFDKMDGLSGASAFYSDVVPGGTPFTIALSGTVSTPIVTYTDGVQVSGVTLNSDWDLDVGNVTMYKIEFSWYGAVGATFLIYTPDLNSAGDARWIRVHSIRASNQFQIPSLGNPFLPMSYYVSRGTAVESWINKYGASFYIDGGDEGTSVLRSDANDGNVAVTTAEILIGLRMKTAINSIRNRMQVYLSQLNVGVDALSIIRLVKNPPTVTGSPTWTTPDALSPIEVTTTSLTRTGGEVLTTFYASDAESFDLSFLFAYNREYLSYPSTAAAGDELYIEIESVSGTANCNAAVVWREQA